MQIRLATAFASDFTLVCRQLVMVIRFRSWQSYTRCEHSNSIFSGDSTKTLIVFSEISSCLATCRSTYIRLVVPFIGHFAHIWQSTDYWVTSNAIQLDATPHRTHVDPEWSDGSSSTVARQLCTIKSEQSASGHNSL